MGRTLCLLCALLVVALCSANCSLCSFSSCSSFFSCRPHHFIWLPFFSLYWCCKNFFAPALCNPLFPVTFVSMPLFIVIWGSLVSFAFVPRSVCPGLAYMRGRRGSLPSVPPRVAQGAVDTMLDAFGMPMSKWRAPAGRVQREPFASVAPTALSWAARSAALLPAPWAMATYLQWGAAPAAAPAAPCARGWPAATMPTTLPLPHPLDNTPFSLMHGISSWPVRPGSTAPRVHSSVPFHSLEHCSVAGVERGGPHG